MTTYYDYLGNAMPVSAVDTSHVDGTSAGGEVLTAPPGPSAISGDGGGDTLIGNTGDVTFYITDPHDVVEQSAGTPGIKTINGWTPYTLPDNIQNLTIQGDFNYAVGNSLDNLIIVTGQQWVDGEGGNDVLVGGSGNATFEQDAGGGNDTIYGWHVGDQIQLTDSPFASFSQIQAAMTQVGNDVVLQVASGQSLTIRATTVAQFNAAEFLMPFNPSVLGAVTFDDEFNSLNLFNPSTGTGVWQTNFGGNLKDQWAYTLVSNGELEEYVTPSFRGRGDQPVGFNPFSISNGILSITAAPIPASQAQDAYDGSYFSGMINTIGTFQQQYGYFEMRAAFPDAAGTWPGFWMEPNPWFPNSEADITEHLGATPNVDYVRAYGGDGSTQTLYNNIYMADPTGFHTYGLLWTQTTVTFYLDGVAVMTGPTPNTWTSPMALILDLAVGGFGGTPDAAAFPSSMQIDYIRAYALADGSSIVQDPTPVLPAATIQADGTPIASSQPAAQTIVENFDANGMPVTSSTIAFSHSAPNPNALPSGETFYVWDNAGAVFGADASGGQLAAATPFFAGNVSQFTGGTWLTNHDIALTYLQSDSGVQDVWVLVFDPLAGTVNKQELGPASGDIHIVATPSGGFAVSWNSGSGIEAIAYDAHAYDGAGWLGQVIPLSGDLTGVNSAGDLVAAASSGQVQLYNVVTPSSLIPATISLSPGQLTQNEGTTFTYTVTRAYDLSATSSVTWDVIGNGANPASAADFQGGVLPSGTVSFNPGDSTETISIVLASGVQLPNNETFAVTLTHVSAAVLGTAVAEGTILDTGGTTPPPAPTVLSVTASDPAGTGAGDLVTLTLNMSAAVTVSGAPTLALNDGATATYDTAHSTTTALVFDYTIGASDTTSNLAITAVVEPGGATIRDSAGDNADLSNVTGGTGLRIGGGTTGSGGETLTANDTAGQVLTGGTDNDIFNAGHNSVVMTGNGGADSFAFQYLPWNAGQITDFLPGTDKIDLSALLQASNYTGSDPVADGYVILQSDGSGGTEVLYDTDGPGSGNTIQYRITDLDHVATSGLTWAQLSGGTSGSGGGSGGGGTTGITLTANDTAGQVLTGTSGDDIFYAGHNSVVMTGNGGADSFVFQNLPWNAGQITDFTPGTDKLDLSALFTAAKYHGTDPIADGYLAFTSDGKGDTQVYVNPHDPNNPYSFLVTTLDHVAPSSIHSTDWIFH